MTEIITSPIASESQHWYAKDGKPAYEVERSDGKGTRPTTLRDARKLGLLPSVTTIIRQAAAPALERWKRQQLLMAALTLPRRDGESEADWLVRVEQDSQEEARKAADRGTAIHAAIEQHYRGEMPDPDLYPWVKAAVAEIERVCGTQAWEPERSFACTRYGYAGKVDLPSPAWIVDTKGKESLADLRLYDEHFMQTGAYSAGLGYHDARCGILFVNRNRPEAKLIECNPSDVAKGHAMFLGLLAYWQAKTGYRP